MQRFTRDYANQDSMLRNYIYYSHTSIAISYGILIFNTRYIYCSEYDAGSVCVCVGGGESLGLGEGSVGG